MAANYLEQLIAEWYEYQGYFIRRNVWVGKRLKGGYDCELDVVGFHPIKKHLIHLEPSMDANSWEERERRYQKKFEAGRTHIPKLFEGFELPTDIEQIAVLGFASNKNRTHLAGGKIVLVSELMTTIFQNLMPTDIFAGAVPEHLPILRSFQFVNQYRNSLISLWTQST